ncbi:S-layer homology domain-containing protein [Aeromicrobium sp. Sec7.5]|uniref:S-layer homology domain-containing protein n=1 Tax=Aeromicrobium sp. Sec7.5 TaxID=3121276 RepID=UPI002FE49042
MRRMVAVLAALALPFTMLVAAPSASAYEAPAVSPFTDVATTQTFYREITWLADQGISTGYVTPNGKRFDPSAPVLREQMAAFLYRAAGEPAFSAPAVSPFVDVATTQTFYKEITWLAAEGISTGYLTTAGRRFDPSAPVLREQMAAFLYRAAEEPAFSPPAVSPFTDVATTRTFYQEITWLAAEGISTGYVTASGKRFDPAAPVLREQMAAFLYRAAGVDTPVGPPAAFDAAPTPTITGLAQVGQVLTAQPGAWSPSATFTYQWSADGTAIPSATNRLLTVAAEMQGRQLSVRVTGSSAGRVTTARESSRTQAVAAGTFATVRPVITGSGTPGSTLTATVAAWTPAAATTTLQWFRNGSPIAGETASTYMVLGSDRGASISVRATGSRAGYTTATAASDAVVVNVPAVQTVSGTISADTVWGPDKAQVYRVTGDLTVAAGATLTLQAGTVVKFQQGRTILVEGNLTANGIPTSPVVLTSVKDDLAVGDTNGDGSATSPAADDYVGLSARSKGTLVMANAQLAYAETAVLAVGEAGAAPTVALSGTAISRSTRCVAIDGPVDGTFTGSVRDCEVGVSANYAFDARGVDWGSASGPFPYGTGVQVQGESVAVLPWTGFVAPDRPAVAAPQATPTQVECRDVVLVGVRGSGEFPESPDPTTYGPFTADESGFGSYNYVVALKMQEQIAAARPSTTFKLMAVQYLALQIPSYDPEIDYLEFLVSVFDGVDKMDQLIQAEAARCPATKFVLIGSSQGALAIHALLTPTFPTSLQARIAGVVLLANPARVPGSTETLWEGANLPATQQVREASGSFVGFFPGAARAVPAWVASRTISMCHEGDVFCAFRPGAHLWPHLTYSTAELDSLAAWQAARVVPQLPTS